MKVRVITEVSIWDFCRKNARALPSFHIFLERLDNCDWKDLIISMQSERILWIKSDLYQGSAERAWGHQFHRVIPKRGPAIAKFEKLITSLRLKRIL